jgi:dimethylamine monooxygenase subunit A
MRMTLGLRPLHASQWLERGPQHEQTMAHKRTVLATSHDQVVATTSPGRPGSVETLELVVDWLREYGSLDQVSPDETLHPLDAAGRLVADDLCVLYSDGSQWRLGAASVCAPSRWRLSEKIGRTVAEIHRPVPEYAGWYGDTVDARLDRLTAQRPLWRLNWSIVDDPALFQPRPPDHGPAPAAVTLADLTVRVERQTLLKLPRTGAIVFTIRTDRARLSDLAADPATAEAFARTLRTCPADLAVYKGWAAMLPRVITLLEHAAGIGSQT